MEDHEAGVELTYKSLALGAWRVVIGVCVVFGGCIGWWVTHFVSTFDQFKRDVAGMEAEFRQEHTKLAARVAELEWKSNHVSETKE